MQRVPAGRAREGWEGRVATCVPSPLGHVARSFTFLSLQVLTWGTWAEGLACFRSLAWHTSSFQVEDTMVCKCNVTVGQF